MNRDQLLKSSVNSGEWQVKSGDGKKEKCRGTREKERRGDREIGRYGEREIRRHGEGEIGRKK